MSVQTELTRIETARDGIRTKLMELGIVPSTANIDICATAIDELENQGAVSATVKDGEVYTIPKGYHNGSGTVSGEGSGGNVTIDGIKVTEQMDLKTMYMTLDFSTLPYSFYQGAAVVLNGEIHILGSYDYKTRHYKWDGTSWASVSTLPYDFYYGSAVVLDGEIHILGRGNSHYKWDGTSWAEVSTLPYTLYHDVAVVLDGEIHLLGGGGGTNICKYHYKWDGTSWAKVGTLPYAFNSGSAVVLDGEIHILGSVNTNHYKWGGTSWASVSTLPYDFYYGEAVVLDGEIHILGSNSVDYGTNHYKWDGTSWASVSTLLYTFNWGSAVVLDGEIHILGGGSSKTSHYSTTAKVYRKVA